MKYLGYYESLEGSRFEIYNTLDEAKRPWCFKLVVFEVPDSFTQEELISIPKPRFPYFCNEYNIVYGDKELLHEKIDVTAKIRDEKINKII